MSLFLMEGPTTGYELGLASVNYDIFFFLINGDYSLFSTMVNCLNTPETNSSI